MGSGLKATLALADGRVFAGSSFGAEGRTAGEVVFNTSMTGYQEILTDPSYDGQIVTMTCPEIGNVGVNIEDSESFKPWVKGFVVREYWDRPSNWRSTEKLGDYMRRHAIVGIEGLDTRALVRHIRDHGAQQAVLASGDVDTGALVAEAQARPSLEGQDLAGGVSATAPYRWTSGPWRLAGGFESVSDEGPLVVAFDFGIKANILRSLRELGCQVAVVPATTTAAEVLELGPDGLFLSNGPGDPEAVSGAIENVGRLASELPTFGICLGHQILSLALGARTFKLKFGHHGGNHPVIDVDSGVVEITAQNHGFAVDAGSLPGDLRVTRLNLNDRTVEGVEHTGRPVFSVQYHPEASPGPHDAHPLFKRFVSSMDGARRGARALELPVRDIEEL